MMMPRTLNLPVVNGANGKAKKPATFADVRLVTGAQGKGKSTIGIGLGIEDHFRHMEGIMSPDGVVLKAQSVDRLVNREDYLRLKKAKIAPNILKYARIYSSDGGRSKLAEIPKGWLPVSPVRLFANFHLYGVEFGLITLADIVENINTELFNDAWILFDESTETDARRSMQGLEKAGTAFYASIRKRRAHFCVMAQYNEMVERRIRLFASWRIFCLSYDEEFHIITCEITKPNTPKFVMDFYAPRYWPFFDTEELVKVSQYKIDKALATVYE